MRQLFIKITGSGTKEEIIKALENLLEGVKAATAQELEAAEWEDATIMTYIND